MERLSLGASRLGAFSAEAQVRHYGGSTNGKKSILTKYVRIDFCFLPLRMPRPHQTPACPPFITPEQRTPGFKHARRSRPRSANGAFAIGAACRGCLPISAPLSRRPACIGFPHVPRFASARHTFVLPGASHRAPPSLTSERGIQQAPLPKRLQSGALTSGSRTVRHPPGARRNSHTVRCIRAACALVSSARQQP